LAAGKLISNARPLEVWTVDLYNLEDGPGEQNNLADPHPGEVERLRALLKTHYVSLGLNLSEGDAGRDSVDAASQPIEGSEELKATGYL